VISFPATVYEKILNIFESICKKNIMPELVPDILNLLKKKL
jgi:hypothetical protein